VTQVPPGESLLAGSRDWPLLLGAAALISVVGALVSIWLGRHHSTRAKLVWTAIAVALPIVGPIAWFVLGREKPRDH
jgi:hypothetical protein